MECPFCGKEIKKLLEKHKSSCVKNPGLGISEDSIEVNESNLDFFRNSSSTFRNVQKVFYICKDCGKKIFKKRFEGISENFLCKSCCQKEVSICPKCGKTMNSRRLPRPLKLCEIEIPEVLEESNLDQIKNLKEFSVLSRKVKYFCKK